MASLSCVSFISALSYSYPVAEGGPVEALSEVWPYIFCSFLSVISGKCDILMFSVFTGALSIPLDIFLQICYFSAVGSPQVLGGECWSSACWAWHEAHVPKFYCVPWWSLIAVVTGIAAPGLPCWGACKQARKAMRKTESSLIPWLWHLLCEGSYGSIGDDGLILILNPSKIFCVIKVMVVMFACGTTKGRSRDAFGALWLKSFRILGCDFQKSVVTENIRKPQEKLGKIMWLLKN